MKKFKFKPLVLAISLSAITNMALADLMTSRAIVNNNGTERVSASANFETSVEGDLYIAVQVDKELIFLTKEGEELSSDVLPFLKNQNYEGKIVLFDFSSADILPGRYSLYKVVTKPGLDPLNFNNWVGGLGGLSSINFSIGLPTEVTQDYDNNGFSDDDLDEDGFHDDDLDRDGFHDDDLDEDGFHDDDNDMEDQDDGDDDMDDQDDDDNDMDEQDDGDDDMDDQDDDDNDMDEQDDENDMEDQDDGDNDKDDQDDVIDDQGDV